MPEIATIALSRPIQVHGETVSELTFREPLGRHLSAAREAEGAGDFTTKLIAACCDVPPSVILDMPARDVTRLSRMLSSFLADEAAPSASPTNSTSAPISGETSPTS